MSSSVPSRHGRRALPWAIVFAISGCGTDVSIVRAPTATIDAPSRDTTITQGDPVSFQGSASDPDGAVASHAWAFGDGQTASVEDPGPHLYGALGAYAVTYQVTDDDGEVSAVATRTVTVQSASGNQAPTATIAAPSRDTTVTLGDAVTFAGSASDPDGTIASHAWAFGDGQTAAVEDPGAHVYAGVGAYSVTYQVTDDEGAPSLPATRTVTVQSGQGAGNYALRFYGNVGMDNDRVKIQVDDPANGNPGPPADIGATDFTIELWMRATPGENTAGDTCSNWVNGNIILDRNRNSQPRDYGLAMGAGRLVFGVRDASNQRRHVCGSVRVDDGQWHHVAITRAVSTGLMRLFVDGSLDAEAVGGAGDVSYPDDGQPGNFCGGPCVNDPYLVLAAEKHNDPAYLGFSGWLDEMRLSTTLRYTGTFPVPSGRFTPDALTAALYHFDEGTGDFVGDGSGATGGPSNGTRFFGGSPAGPAWVSSDAPTGNE